MNDFLACILVDNSSLAKTARTVSNYKICGAPVFSYIIDELKQLDISQIIFSAGTPEPLMNLSSSEEDRIHVAANKQDVVNIIRNITNQEAETILIIKADLPAIQSRTLKEAYEYHISKKNKVTVLVQNNQNFPENDYCGICFVDIDEFYKFLDTAHALENLSEILLRSEKSDFYKISDSTELIRVKDSYTLNLAEQVILKRIIVRHMANGVIFHLPDTCYIHKDVKIGSETVVYPGTILEGNTVIGESCEVGPYSRVTDGIIGNNVKFMNSVMIQSQIGDNSTVGPFAYIRPGSEVGRNVKIGDFVEIKNSVIDDNTKVSHLTYVGDADVGKNVNFGCGSVLVNYDGKRKHRSKIGNNAFIGCNANLVSPVVINDYAYIAAGSTITDEVPEYALAIARNRQTIIENWVKRKGLDNK